MCWEEEGSKQLYTSAAPLFHSCFQLRLKFPSEAHFYVELTDFIASPAFTVSKICGRSLCVLTSSSFFFFFYRGILVGRQMKRCVLLNFEPDLLLWFSRVQKTSEGVLSFKFSV